MVLQLPWNVNRICAVSSCARCSPDGNKSRCRRQLLKLENSLRCDTLRGRLSELRFVESNQHLSSVFGWYDLLCISPKKGNEAVMNRKTVD